MPATPLIIIMQPWAAFSADCLRFLFIWSSYQSMTPSPLVMHKYIRCALVRALLVRHIPDIRCRQSSGSVLNLSAISLAVHPWASQLMMEASRRWSIDTLDLERGIHATSVRWSAAPVSVSILISSPSGG